MGQERTGEERPAIRSPRTSHYDEESKTCICPAGEFLYQNGSQVVIQGREAVKFTGAKRVCGPCPLRDQCLRHPERTPVRQVVFFTGVVHKAESHTVRMKQKIDSEEGRRRYGATLCHGGAGVRQHPPQQAAQSLHATRTERRSIRSGSSTAWCTTSRSSRITGIGSEKGKKEAIAKRHKDIEKRISRHTEFK